MQDKSKNKKIKRVSVTRNADIVNSIINQPASKTDPNGSYTGKPISENEMPVQDADDL